MAIFAEAISALPPQCRRVFLLRKVQGLSQKDVAQRLGLSVSTVEKHLATGLVKCSEYLKLRGYEVGSGPAAVANRPQHYRSKGGSNADV
jgi:RNA polymerase sigma-70 factor (ECF subfamily)